ncbi:MAG: hypothetical protein NTY38_11625 [Acidobacteria bacterium]|nr:hypothetical protein [Acidobacteriota bacterium]
MRPYLALPFLFVLLVPCTAQSPQTVTAINEVEKWQQVGQQPYEFTWVQRQEDPRVLEKFENLTGWTLELHDGASGELRRSREQQMWGEHVAKFVFSGTPSGSRIVARPPKPLAIAGAFDSVDLWGYGNRWSWVEDTTTPAVKVAVLLVDARGKEFRVPLADVNWKQWWLIHRKTPVGIAKEITFPASFTGIEISEIRNKDPRHFYCDSLVFYQEQLKPLAFKPQPKRNLRPFRGQITGNNLGPGTLPFPTREETILPSNFEKAFTASVRKTGGNRFELRYQGKDATIVYAYQPAAGTLDEITTSVDGGAAFHPLRGGGVRFTDTAPGQVAHGELVAAGVSNGVISARFRMGARVVDYQLRLWQKSLVFDAWCDGGEASELDFGMVDGVSAPRLITIPFLTYGRTNPRVLLSGAAARPLFTSIWFDWYRTNASEPYYTEKPEVTASSARINGGMRYAARTDGKRNNLYERIFITSSPVYEETLLTIANPPSLRQQEGKQVLWTVTGLEGGFEGDHQRSREIRSYGLDKIMQHSHEVTWRDEGDSNTMKLKASPQKGGDAALKWYIQAQNDLGWLQGVYTNYTDFCTVNSNWSPDHVLRLTDGEWKRAWPRNYSLKPAKSVEFDEYYARRIKDKFGVKMSYTDVHSAVSPWSFCDFDARVPGAATLAATFYAFGQLLLNDQRVYGPTQSEATYQWLYAGLASGHYGWVYTKVNLLTHPLDVAFLLHKLHPLECDYGMGYTFYYLEQLDPKWASSPKRRDYLDLFLATTIGYGNIGWLVREFNPATPFGAEAMTRSYYMMQQLQQQYAFVKPKVIEYAGQDGKLLNASRAHSTGAIALSRLHVVYENGTEVYVNRGSTGVWKVRDVELPPSGWLVFNPANGFREMSANVEGRRIDHVTSAAFEFLDGRGQWTRLGALGATGSVVVRPQATGALELIDLYGNDRIQFAARGEGTLTAFDPAGRNLGQVPLTAVGGGWHEFKPLAGGRRYVFNK